jgi:hypothetical protein
MQLQRNVMMAVRAWLFASRKTPGDLRGASPARESSAHRAGASGGEVAGYATLVRL